MNCNKCGTPILPGENTCRFCGAINDYSKRVPKKEKPEIIDFDIEDNIIEKEPKIINFMFVEDEVSIDPEPSKEVIDFDDLYDISDKPQETPEIIDVDKNEIPVVNPVMDEPATAIIPVKEVKQILQEEKEESPKQEEMEIIDVSEPIIEEKKIVEPKEIKKEKEENKKLVKEEKIAEKKEKNIDKDEQKEENSKTKTVKNNNVLVIVLIMLLILSIILNCFLLMGRAKNLDVSEVGVSTVLTDTIYNNYEFRVPNNWNVNNSDKEKMLLYDNSKTWGESINLVGGIDYNLTKENITKITEEFGKNNYLFTSDYTKTVNEKELYVFKGKYYSYATYIIITKVDEENVAIVDLKFTGEVKEDVLDSTFNILATAKKTDTSKFLTNNFEFNNVTQLLSNVLKKKDK